MGTQGKPRVNAREREKQAISTRKRRNEQKRIITHAIMATSEDTTTAEQAVAERRMDFSYHELPYTITEGIVSTLPRGCYMNIFVDSVFSVLDVVSTTCSVLF